MLTGIVLAAYIVTYNPYGDVDWNTTLRAQVQHHDHINSTAKIAAYDAANYDAVIFMTYSGAYRGSTESPPCSAVGWVDFRRWPVEYFVNIPPLTNIKFFIPGAEDLGLLSNDTRTIHTLSPFLTEYIEGVGSPLCPNTLSLLGPEFTYDSNQELIDTIWQNGGEATLNHPGFNSTYLALENYGSTEIFNNFMALRDEVNEDGVSNRIENMLAFWDEVLETRSTQIWGVSSNDWFGAAATPGGDFSGIPGYLTAQNLDRGKMQALVPMFDLDSYRAAFEAGAFFAIMEDNAIKSAYPTVTDIQVGTRNIKIFTSAGNETITWIGNGGVVKVGDKLRLQGLPAGLVYVRAEIDDGAGRVVYTQPFTLSQGERFRKGKAR